MVMPFVSFFDPDSAVADPSNDGDHDGQTNHAEFLSLTDPADSASLLRVTLFSRDPSTGGIHG